MEGWWRGGEGIERVHVVGGEVGRRRTRVDRQLICDVTCSTASFFPSLSLSPLLHVGADATDKPELDLPRWELPSPKLLRVDTATTNLNHLSFAQLKMFN